MYVDRIIDTVIEQLLLRGRRDVNEPCIRMADVQCIRMADCLAHQLGHLTISEKRKEKRKHVSGIRTADCQQQQLTISDR